MRKIIETGLKKWSLTPTILGGNSSVRLITMRATTRAAVHGTKAPFPDVLDEKQVEMEIGRLKEARIRKMKKVEETVDSQLSSSQLLSTSRILKLT